MFILLKSKFYHINMAYLTYPFPYRWTFRKFQSFTIIKIRIMIILDSGAHMQQFSILMHKHGLAGPQDVSIFHFPKYFQMFPKLGWQFTILCPSAACEDVISPNELPKQHLLSDRKEIISLCCAHLHFLSGQVCLPAFISFPL